MFKFKPLFEIEKCDSCNGTGKSHFHLFKFEKDEVGIIRKTFPKFDPKKSCGSCFGDGKTDRFSTSRVFHELNTHTLNKIWDEGSRRLRRE